MRPSELPVVVVRLPLVLAGGIAKRASGAAVVAVRTVQGVVGRRDDGGPEPFVAEPEPIVVPEPAVEPVVVAEPAAEPVVDAVAEPVVDAEPIHVSEEPELVAEVAETGAEEGAGAEVSIDPPWPGYDGMTAEEIRARLAEESSEAAATVSLYEASRKGRRSVLEAAAAGMRG